MTHSQYCSVCGAPNVAFARFCDACGSRLAHVAQRSCPTCGATALPGDRFCDECGAPLPASALLIIEDSGWRLALPERAEVIIGREDPLSGAKPDLDVGPHSAESQSVSRRHARILRKPDSDWLEDLGSVNFTYYNDQRLEPGRPIALHDGDRIVIGRLGLVFRKVELPASHA